MLRETINELELQLYTMDFKDMSSYIVNSLGFSDLDILIAFKINFIQVVLPPGFDNSCS